MAKVFFSYSHADEALRDQLETQLSMLKRQGVIETWHDRRIGAGEEFGAEIDRHVETDDVILLLVSADFIASDYCYNLEMKRAMERHEAREAIVIPVILRACEWHGAPFGKLNATPPNGLPITQHPDRDQAMLEVAKAVRAAAERIGQKAVAPAPAAQPSARTGFFSARDSVGGGPRSSNLALAKTFTEREKDTFKLETFEYIAKYFENSASEIAVRNQDVESTFRRIDANHFSTVIYKNGESVSRCTIFIGDRPFGSGIAYSQSESGNGYNESLSVEADDQSMFLRSVGMASLGRGRSGEGALTQEGAAELYWNMLIQPLQPRR